MMVLDNIYYNIPNLNHYNNLINILFKNEKLRNLGLKKEVLGYTEYGYKIDYLTIGDGDNDIFIVGGTHGSEVITVDYVTQLIEQLAYIDDFDPNLFKINIIPIQNPEGFDISSSTYSDINYEDFLKKSKEYYLRYRTDSLIVKAIGSLNNLMNDLANNDVNSILSSLKTFVTTDRDWLCLKDTRAIPNIVIFNNKLHNLSNVNNYNDLKIKLLYICNSTIDSLDNSNIHDLFLINFLNIVKKGFDNNDFWNEITNEKQDKLHQQMFSGVNVNNLRSFRLINDLKKVYKLNPKGSQIGHDATGSFINLNANHLYSPGINRIKNGDIVYGPGPKNNIRNYFTSPLGMPCLNCDNFEYSIENKLLYKLLKDSYEKGNYLMTLLYHGTGGLIYYKPYEDEMDNSIYREFYNYNKCLAETYNEGIINVNSDQKGYRMIDSADNTGYGDLLRRTFPGVLLIELSRMGGNPIAPYGDMINLHSTFNENFGGIKSILNYFKKKLNDKGIQKKFTL